jgi:coenzyme F420 hydrogenase subunit beta
MSSTSHPLHYIWKKDYCIGCGACAASCPMKIIEYNFSEKNGRYIVKPKSNNLENCLKCNICISVCPVGQWIDDSLGNEPDFADLDQYLVGPSQQIFTGFASDKKVRRDSSSGGIITSLLIFLLKNKKVDFAIVCVPDMSHPYRHKMALINTPDEVISSQGTVYSQVDYSGVWEALKKLDSSTRFALIGLPCQLTALDNIIKKMAKYPKIIKIGLFCGGISNHKALNFLLTKNHIDRNAIKTISYRSGDWPIKRLIIKVLCNAIDQEKDVTLIDQSASVIQSIYWDFYFRGSFFPNGCFICRDQTAEHATISLGDAYLKDIYPEDKLGTNILISRDETGQGILKDAEEEGVILLKKCSLSDVIDSQGNSLVGRKLGLWGMFFENRENYNSSITDQVRKKYPQYLPSKSMIIERTIIQKAAKSLPIPFLSYFYLFYRSAGIITLSIENRLRNRFIKIQKQ